MPAISIIIPIYNEIEKLPLLIEQLEPYKYKNQIIIVNDGSEDGSKKILNSQKNLEIIHHSINLGKGAAIRTALKAVKEDIVMTIDGDLEIDINCIEILIRKFELSNECVVVGNRWRKDNYNDNNINTFGNYFINKIFNSLYKTELNDILCCVKILNKKLFNSLNLNSNGFSIEAEIMSKLVLKRTNILEVEVKYNRRSQAQGKKLKISDGWGILLKMIRIRFKST
jgi:glycosyltransferase involved in cell wall biosynthesis